MKNIAHRGANREAPENSFQAFALAIDAGSTMLEFDVRLSSDGKAVIMHDPSLLRTAKIDRLVSDLSSTEISQIKLENGDSVPLLDDFLSAFDGKVGFNIEIKGDDIKLAEVVCQSVQPLKNRSEIIISAKSLKVLGWLAVNMKDWQRAPVLDEDSELVREGRICTAELAKFMTKFSLNIIHPWVKFVDQELMEACRRNAWTVNCWAAMDGDELDAKEKLWDQVKKYGVSGYITNCPREFQNWLKQVK